MGFDLVNHTSGGDGLSMGNETSFKKGRKSELDTNTFITCKICGKSVKTSPSRINKKFCSNKCREIDNSINKLTNSGCFKKGCVSLRKGIKTGNLRPDYKISDETKRKISNTLKLKGLKNNRTPVKQYNKDMVLINSFASIQDAGKYTGINPSSISNNVNGLSKSAGGYIWLSME